jgi:hypothetical protein
MTINIVVIQGSNGSGGAPGMSGLPVNPLATAHSGGGQANATQLSNGWTPTTSGGGGDSFQLPSATAGAQMVMYSVGGVNPFIFFAKNGTSDTINGQSNATAFDSAADMTICTCAADGAWDSNALVD